MFRIIIKAILLAVLLTPAAYGADADDGYTDNLTENMSGITSLMSAVSAQDVEGVKFFATNARSTINHRNIGGATALNIACRINNLEIIKLLLQNGANPNIADSEGITPLMHAVIAKNSYVTKLLIEKGANISATNANKETVISYAAISDCADCLQEIMARIESGQFDYKIFKTELHDALIIARNKDNKAVQDVLIGYLADYSKKINTASNENVKSAIPVSTYETVSNNADTSYNKSVVISVDNDSKTQYKLVTAVEIGAAPMDAKTNVRTDFNQNSHTPSMPSVASISDAPNNAQMNQSNNENSKFKFVAGQPSYAVKIIEKKKVKKKKAAAVAPVVKPLVKPLPTSQESAVAAPQKEEAAQKPVINDKKAIAPTSNKIGPDKSVLINEKPVENIIATHD